MKRLLCRLMGHWPNRETICHGYTWCQRCDCAISLNRVQISIFTPFAMLRDWAKPCADCGKRFDRHDDSITHIPF